MVGAVGSWGHAEASGQGVTEGNIALGWLALEATRPGWEVQGPGQTKPTGSVWWVKGVCTVPCVCMCVLPRVRTRVGAHLRKGSGAVVCTSQPMHVAVSARTRLSVPVARTCACTCLSSRRKRTPWPCAWPP